MARKDYTVRLERVFQGPMDLLLHLVREQEVEIHEIEISRILVDYLSYIEQLKALDIELAGDFLVMAATLMSIKSRSLLPNEEVDLEEELDPKDELIQQLLEYRRFKDAAEHLEEDYHTRARMTDRGYHEKAERKEREFDLGELSVWDLLSTFSRLMRETLADRPHHIVSDPRPLRYYVDEVVSRLRSGEHISLRGLMKSFENAPPREALVGSFCALLELVRLELIIIRQGTDQDDIEIEIRPEHMDDLEDIVDHTVLDEEELKEGGAASGALEEEATTVADAADGDPARSEPPVGEDPGREDPGSNSPA